jgi:hypothetical protein
MALLAGLVTLAALVFGIWRHRTVAQPPSVAATGEAQTAGSGGELLKEAQREIG